jgi:triosephosphate isomerase
MNKLIIANWKSYITNLAQAQEILEFTNNYLEPLMDKKSFSLVFCPPPELIEEVSKLLKVSNLKYLASLGAQDMTDEILKLGAQYVITGHSDRRWKLGESDEVVNQKLKTALENNLIPIVCLGEKVRDKDFINFLYQQTQATFDGLSVDELDKCIVAYEPVWAISSTPGAKPDTPENAGQSISVIWDTLAYQGLTTTPVTLYGGSVNSENIEKFLKWWQIAGVLIGKASTQKEEFVRILAAVSELTK